MFTWRLWPIIAAWVFLSASAFAQISPGELSQPHAELEGMGKCTSCHELGQVLNGRKCLDCHTEIETRISKKRGFHGSPATSTKECVECHREHKGREYPVVNWTNSKKNFDHALTGYVLNGKHSALGCEACHRPDHVKDADILSRVSQGLSLKKTLLGLSRDCLSCHFDEHRGQLTKVCSTCHDAEDWAKSAKSKFDHSNAAFQLVGKHAEIECSLCHTGISDPVKTTDGRTDISYTKFKNIKSDQCTDCHKDPHQNQFGKACDKCHSPVNWLTIKGGSFNHEKTNYPLTGKHRLVGCALCHQPNTKGPVVYKGLPHALCSECHKDAHGGQFAQRADKGKCESCHTTDAFIPSKFTVSDHGQTKYQLTGAHAAVPCNQCHTPGNNNNVKSNLRISRANFVFTSIRCSTCHNDIHNGQFKDVTDKKGCDACHVVETWNALVFDHDRDCPFPLRGKHKTTACYSCHPVSSSARSQAEAKYKGIATACEACHADVHFGQFAKSGGSVQTDCRLCHNEDRFKPSVFDHSKAAFSLAGAHEKVACGQCHKTVTLKNGATTIVYRPVATDCAACHSNLKQKR